MLIEILSSMSGFFTFNHDDKMSVMDYMCEIPHGEKLFRFFINKYANINEPNGSSYVRKEVVLLQY